MIEKFQNWFHENSITEVECLVPDLGGIARGKILPTNKFLKGLEDDCLLYTSPSPRDRQKSRMPSSA